MSSSHRFATAQTVKIVAESSSLPHVSANTLTTQRLSASARCPPLYLPTPSQCLSPLPHAVFTPHIHRSSQANTFQRSVAPTAPPTPTKPSMTVFEASPEANTTSAPHSPNKARPPTNGATAPLPTNSLRNPKNINARLMNTTGKPETGYSE